MGKDRHHTYKFSGAVYVEHPPELMRLLGELFELTAYTNPLHSDWPLLGLMEAELISWCQNLFGGESGGPGIITHGGTTSIIEAINAYVMHARQVKDIQTPEIVVPETAHVAFIKAARLTGAKLVVVPVDKSTGAVDPKALESYISKKTAMIAASAPSFMYGVADPIKSLGKIALKHNIGFHVDACLGGFVTAFDKNTKHTMDLSVPGVTSLSADTHKYGYAPKGSSILLFKKGCPYHTASIDLEWCGGMYITKGILDGSRSGVPIATTHAVMSYYGQNHYEKVTEKILGLTAQIRESIDSIDDIYAYGDPKLTVVGLRSDKLDIHVIADRMKDKWGWSLTRLQNPDGFHFCVTQAHLNHNVKKEFIDSLKESVLYARENPDLKPKGEAKAYGKFKKGVPEFVQNRIGLGYIELLGDLSMNELLPNDQKSGEGKNTPIKEELKQNVVVANI